MDGKEPWNVGRNPLLWTPTPGQLISTGVTPFRAELIGVVWFLLIFLLSLGAAYGQDAPQAPKPTDAPTFSAGYMWRQVVVQGVPDAEGAWSGQRGDVFGGRVVAGLGFGRVGFEVRLDASGLKDQFNLQDPSTFKTLELYAAAHVVAYGAKGVQLGPALVMGSITSFDTEPGQPQWSGFGADLVAGGARVGGFGSEVYVLVGRTTYLAEDPKVRAVLAVHVRLTNQLYAVGDAVTGRDGFVRAGIAVRAW